MYTVCICIPERNGSWLQSTWWFDNVTVMVDAMYESQTSLADNIRIALEEYV